jgi:hypothetical protein
VVIHNYKCLKTKGNRQNDVGKKPVNAGFLRACRRKFTRVRGAFHINQHESDAAMMHAKPERTGKRIGAGRPERTGSPWTGPDPETRAMPIKEVARTYHISVATIWRGISSGRIKTIVPSGRPGGRRLVLLSSLEEPMR